jgi:hypothetical protein
MYGKYTNYYNGDVTSMASLDSKKSKIVFDNNTNSKNNRSERKKNSKNLIGNKTHRSSKSSIYDDIISINEDEKMNSNIKYLKDNLKEMKPKVNKNGKVGKKDKSKSTSKNNSSKELDIKKVQEEKKNNSMLLAEEIKKNLDTLIGTEKIITLYKTNLNKIKSLNEEKERKSKQYEDIKLNINSTKKELNVLNEIISIKSKIINSTKKHKYFGNIFEKSKQTALNYKNIFDKQIENIQKNFTDMKTIEANLFNILREINDKIQEIDETNKGNKYLVKNEIKKDINNLMKSMKNENKIIDNLCVSNEFDNDTDDIEEMKTKFNNIAIEINQEKEIYE